MARATASSRGKAVLYRPMCLMRELDRVMLPCTAGEVEIVDVFHSDVYTDPSAKPMLAPNEAVARWQTA